MLSDTRNASQADTHLLQAERIHSRKAHTRHTQLGPPRALQERRDRGSIAGARWGTTSPYPSSELCCQRHAHGTIQVPV
jgi:hypothetical protein